MLSSSFLGCVGSSSSSRVKLGPASTSAPKTFAPFGKYADVGSQKIKTSHPGVRLYVGSASTLYLNKGTLLGKDITYISQVWNAWDAESTQLFYEQVLPYIHPETLRPLMGICTPTVIGIYNTAAGGLSLAMELPHATGWCQADPYISAELKERVIMAYQTIHGRNILHNDAKLENILIGDDGEVTIVDFCKMVVDAKPADFALEMRIVKFMLDYNGAKEAEYERLRRAESRAGKDTRRSWLHRAAETLGLTSGEEYGVPPSLNEIDSPPFGRQCLMKWDSEVVTEGTTHCPGWRGECFEVPEDMRSPPWPGIKDYSTTSLAPHQLIDSAGLVESVSGPDPFDPRSEWSKHCHYTPRLWSPLPEFADSDLRKFVGSSSSSTTPTDLSDYVTGSERSSTAGTEPCKGDFPIAPLFARKRLRIEDITPPDDYAHGNKRARRSRSLETFAKYEGEQSSWATCRIEGLGFPPLSPKLKGKEREPLPLVASPRETSPSEPDLPTLADLSPSPRKSVARRKRTTLDPRRRRVAASTDPRRLSPPTWPTSASTSPRRHRLRSRSERRCSVIVVDSDEEDKVWFMSREALKDVKGYLQVKKATGAAVEMPSGGKEGGARLSHTRAERAVCSSSTRPTRKRACTPEVSEEETQTPKRRRSWPETNPYGTNPRTDFVLSSHRGTPKSDFTHLCAANELR